MNRNVKIFISYIILFIYLALLSIFISVITINIYVTVAQVFAGTIGFSLLLNSLIGYVPALKGFMASILDIFGRFTIISKVQIRYRIEGLVNEFRENIEKDIRGILAYPLKIKWDYSGDDLKSYLDQEEQTVIVRLKPRENEDWNLASATLAYVSAGLVVTARPHMGHSLSKAIDFSFTKKILEDEGRIRARNYLVQEEITPIITKNEEMRINYNKLSIISDELLTRIYLREIDNTSIRLSHLTIRDLHKDYINFLEWTVNLVTRDGTGKQTPFLFSGKNFRIGIILVAEENTFISYGSGPYLKRARERVADGVDALYILARGAHILIAEIIAKDIEKSDLGLIKVKGAEKKYKVRFPDGQVDAVSILFRPKM